MGRRASSPPSCARGSSLLKSSQTTTGDQFRTEIGRREAASCARPSIGLGFILTIGTNSEAVSGMRNISLKSGHSRPDLRRYGTFFLGQPFGLLGKECDHSAQDYVLRSNPHSSGVSCSLRSQLTSFLHFPKDV